MGINDISEKLNITPQEAISLKNHFLSTFPGIKSFINNTKSEIQNNGSNKYVKSIMGRRRYISNCHSKNDTEKLYIYITNYLLLILKLNLNSRAERQAVNSIIQGSASDIIKYAMIGIFNSLQSLNRQNPKSNEKYKLILQLHDELVIQVPILPPTDISNLVEEYKKIMEVEVVKYMENNFRVKFNVPLIVKVKIGKTLGDMKPYETLK